MQSTTIRKKHLLFPMVAGWCWVTATQRGTFTAIRGKIRRPKSDLTQEQKAEQAKLNKEKKETFAKIASYEFDDI